MTDAQLAVIGSLAGVLFGVAGTLATTFMQQRAENRRTKQRIAGERRKERAELIASFSAAELKAWNLVAHLWHVDQALAATPAGLDVSALRSTTLTSVDAATSALLERTAMLTILFPDLNDVLTPLVEIYGDFPLTDLEAQQKAHASARAAFEEKARALLSL